MTKKDVVVYDTKSFVSRKFLGTSGRAGSGTTNPNHHPGCPATTQTDLTGTYTGTFRCEAAGLTGDTTLTINGNEFTTSDGKTGRIVASTTGGYTAVALSMPGSDPTAAPTVISMRGNKRGNRLTLTPVAWFGDEVFIYSVARHGAERRGHRPRLRRQERR